MKTGSRFRTVLVLVIALTMAFTFTFSFAYAEPEEENAPKDISIGCVYDLSPQTYTGKAIRPEFWFDVDGDFIDEGVGYTAVYTNNVNVGTAAATLTGIGNYTGTYTFTFQVVPVNTSKYAVKRLKKGLKVTWKKVTKKMSKVRVSRYQIQVAMDKDFNNIAKQVTVKGYKKTSKTIKGLKAKRTYYVRMCTYVMTGSGKYFSKWSAVKKQKTK